MAMTCSALGLFRSPKDLRLCSSLSLIGRDEAARSALPFFNALKPVLEPWAASSTSTRRPCAVSPTIRNSLALSGASLCTLSKPCSRKSPSTSAGPNAAPMVLEP
ncbi:hypothetical protein D3C85_1627810 [compost metagenome]